jgi:putative peptide zinc metalloprotease protein
MKARETVKRIALVLAAVLCCFTFAAVRPPAAAAQDNAAVAINTKDGTSIFRVAFQIARVNKDIVDNTNAAAAWASCTECQAIAAAFQIVLIFSDPEVATPTNLALAINWECDACVAFASAYQWVLTTGGPVHFTAAGNQQLAEVRQRLHELSQMENLTLEELLAELEALAEIIRNVLANEMVSAGPAEETSPPPPPPPPAPSTTTEPTDTTTTTTTTEPTTTTTP